MIQRFEKMMLRRSNRKGFTLVELMVVVVILGILVAIAVPVYNTATKTAQDNADKVNIRTIEGAITTYLASTGGGAYANVVLGADGAISGTGITPGNLVPNYLKEMPKRPTNSAQTYSKAANAEVVGGAGAQK